MNKFCIALITILICVVNAINAQVSVPAIFSDNMVLQQQSEVNLWGWANPHQTVNISTSWSDKSYSVKTSKEGKWSIKIHTPEATTNQTISIKGDNEIAINNILIGEVWLCSGQSNMEYPTAKSSTSKWKTGMFDYDEIMKNASFDNMRLFIVEHQLAPYAEQDNCVGKWVVCNPDNLKDFSAVGFIFGRSLLENINQPIGIIQSTWGGTHAESWTPMPVMAKNALYKDVLNDFAEKNIKQKKDSCKVPATLWNGMIAPISPYTIKGVIWYQGESNAIRADKYQQVFTNMINAWRKEWKNNKLPFYFVQIAPHYGQPASIRQAQFDTWRSVANTGMVVVTDVGDSTDIHPRNKVVPGERLARWALNRDYGKNIACESPYLLSTSTDGNTIIATFANANEGLKAADNGQVEGFMIAGDDRRFYTANAITEGNKVRLTSPKVNNPVAVRYGYGKWFKVNLCNSDGLPAVPFRTDNWEPDLNSRKFADSEMNRFTSAWRLDHGKRLYFGYAQGVGCTAMLKMWKSTGDRRYFDYVEQWADSLINDNGDIHLYDMSTYNIDFINSGKVLFDCYQETGKEKYRKAMDLLITQMKRHPRTTDGGYWHKLIYQHQIWLDGLYMCSPFLAQYGTTFNKPEWIEEAINQIKICHAHTYDKETGLYHHAWDESKRQRWANPETGHSPNFWGRSIGWWFMALVDNLDFIPEDHPDRPFVISLVQGLADTLPKYQDKNGLWYQVLDCPTRKGNFPEASVTTQFMYAYAKAVNKGYIDKSYRQYAEKAFNGINKRLIGTTSTGDLTLTKCCSVGGLGGNPYRDGSFEYYIGEKMRNDDAKATGPYIMGCLELGL